MQALSAAIQELSVDDRQCIVLREINGLTSEEIARALDISLGAVKSRIRRARGRLCALILQDGNFSEYSSSNDYAGEVKP
jgi:RNA polymerase sigma-70 factor (ECF subfamily)